MSETKSPVTAEGFAWMARLSSKACETMLSAMAETKEYAALIEYAASGATHSNKTGTPVFQSALAASVFSKLDQHGDDAYPAMQSWLDALARHTPAESRLDEAAGFMEACAGRHLRTKTWNMIATYLSKLVPGLLGTPTASLKAEGQDRSVWAIAISTMVDSDPLPSIFEREFAIVPAATSELNVIEFALLASKPAVAQALLDRCVDSTTVLEAMGQRAAALLLSKEKMRLNRAFGETRQDAAAAMDAFMLIAGGAKIDHETWQKLFDVKLRPEPNNNSVHSLPFVVARYLEPYHAARVLKAMIEDGGLDPNYTISSRSTLLHAAVKKNSIAAAEVLLAAGADPTRLDRQKLTPAKLAEERNAPAIGNLMYAAEMRWKILNVANQARSAGAAP